MKRVILSGGGTGGHIYPAITIAREIEELEKADILFVGTPNGMESTIIPKEGFAFRSLEASGLKRELTFENVKTIIRTMGSLWKARKILKDFRPDVVIGTGGYVCGPILLAAALSHIPTMVQEQNVIPGITNKILSRFVDKVALGYEAAKDRFPRPEKCIFTGNPVRKDVLSYQRHEARERLGINSDAFMILVTGGSRGARSINRAMIGVHKYFADIDNVCLYHVTGELDYERVKNALGNVHGDKYGKGSRIITYEYHMPMVLAAADLIICRAGAVSLAEIAAQKLPSILIPYPYAAEDHQTYNAEAFVNAGAAKMIIDKYISDKELIQDIEDLRGDPFVLESMAKAVEKLRKIDAGKEIAKMAIKLAERGCK